MMKKLNKLQISPEKLMKNEELIHLRGGTNCWCFYGCEPGVGGVCATGTAGSTDECLIMCHAAGCCGYSFTGY